MSLPIIFGSFCWPTSAFVWNKNPSICISRWIRCCYLWAHIKDAGSTIPLTRSNLSSYPPVLLARDSACIRRLHASEDCSFSSKKGWECIWVGYLGRALYSLSHRNEWMNRVWLIVPFITCGKALNACSTKKLSTYIAISEPSYFTHGWYVCSYLLVGHGGA